MTCTAEEFAWFAGLFEGEGTINFAGKAQVRLRIGMTDEDVVRRAHTLLGGLGHVYGPSRAGRLPHHKSIYTWATGDRAVVRDLLSNLRPFLGERRGARADEALERIANARPRVALCGTHSGAKKHYDLREEPCEPCLEAKRAHERERYRIRKAKRLAK